MATTIHIDPNGDVLLQFPAQPPSRREDLLRIGGSQGHDSSPPDRGSDTETADWTPGSVSSRFDTEQGNPGPINLLVSSSVLCLVSPVFSALFSGPMAEGVAFRAANSPRPFPLPLPEDSGAAFTVIANVFHHRSAHVPEVLSSDALLEIAALADKYDLTAALRPHGILWIQRATSSGAYHPECSDLIEKCQLLLFAYVLDLPSEFAGLSWEILLMHRQLYRDEVEYGFELPISRDHELLRHDLHAEFSRRKARLRGDLQKAIMEPIAKVTSQLSVHAMHYDNNAPPNALVPSYPSWTCPNASSAIGTYITLLDTRNLLPWRAQYETDAFGNIIDNALAFAAEESENFMLVFEMCDRGHCACSNLRWGDGVHLARKLASAVENAREWKWWVCLDCLKREGEDKGRGECRVKHW